MKKSITFILIISSICAFNISFAEASKCETKKQNRTEIRAFFKSIENMSPNEKQKAIKEFRQKQEVKKNAEAKTQKEKVSNFDSVKSASDEANIKNSKPKFSEARKKIERAKKPVAEIQKSDLPSAEKNIQGSDTIDEFRQLRAEFFELQKSLMGKSLEERKSAISEWNASAKGIRFKELSKKMNKAREERIIELREKIKAIEASNTKSDADKILLEELKFQLEMATASPEKRAELIRQKIENSKALKVNQAEK